METHPLNNIDDPESPDSASMMKRSPSSETPSVEARQRRRRAGEEEEEEDGGQVNDLLVYYARNSTMHGIPSIVGSKLYRGRHVFWMCIVCMMALFLGTVIYWQMSDYYDYPTVTSVDIHYVEEGDFPAITICDPNIFHRGILLHRLLKISNYTMFQLAKLTEIEGLYHRYAQRLLDKEKDPPQPGTTDTVAETEKLLAANLYMVKNSNPLYCSWGDFYWTACPSSKTRITEMGVCSTIDVNSLVNVTKEANFSSEKRSSQTVGNYMRGFTFYLDTRPAVGNYRIFKNQGFKVVLHEADQEPLPMSNGVNIPGNANVEVSVSKHVKEGLPPPYKAFGTATCVEIDKDSFKNPLKRFENYSKEVCEHECFIDFVVEYCGGCRHFLHPGNESLCTLDHLAMCYREAQRLYYGGQDAKCHCPLPCRQVNFKAAVSSNPFIETEYMKELKRRANNSDEEFLLSYVHIYYSDPVRTTMRQVAIYSTEGLLGSIGGQIGLFMGFSLVTVAEMLELLFLLATRGRKLDEHVKRHKKEQEAAAQAAIRPA